MKPEIIHSLTKNFESFAHKTEDGLEFWFARDLQKLLGYSKWENFLNAITKAKVACETFEEQSQYHFPDIRKMVNVGSGALNGDLLKIESENKKELKKITKNK